MDTDTVVAIQLDDVQRLLAALDDKNIVFRAACYVKPDREDPSSLVYIVAPVVDEQGAVAAYGQVYPVVRSLESAAITDSQITLVGENHPVAREALNLLRRYPNEAPIRLKKHGFNGMEVEDLWIFPPAPVEVKIYGMAFRGLPEGGALSLSFEPHNPHSGLTVETMGERKEYPAQTGIDWQVAAPAGSKLEQDEHGQKVLAWNFRGKEVKSRPSEVWSLAHLNLNGFRFIREPG